MRIVHVCAGWEPHNGAANIARMLAAEQKRAGHEIVLRSWASPCELCRADEVWIHCGWLPCLPFHFLRPFPVCFVFWHPGKRNMQKNLPRGRQT